MLITNMVPVLHGKAFPYGYGVHTVQLYEVFFFILEFSETSCEGGFPRNTHGHGSILHGGYFCRVTVALL